MDEQTEVIKGSCLCGKVTFSCQDKFQDFQLCFCKQCQKTSGSAHAANLFTQIDNINWITGKELVKRFDVKGRAISKAFCSECGCSLPYISGTGKALVVPAGCLDTPAKQTVQQQIFCSEQPTWYQQSLTSKRKDKF